MSQRESRHEQRARPGSTSTSRHLDEKPCGRQREIQHQGEDLGRWVRTVRLGWDKLSTVQQWLREQVLGIELAGEDEKP